MSGISSIHNPSLKHTRKHIQSLSQGYKDTEELQEAFQEQYKHTSGQVDSSFSLDDSLDPLLHYKYTLFRCKDKLQMHQEAYDPRPPANMNTSPADAIWSFQNGIIEPSEPHDKAVYLCVTDGFFIYCLDLKESKDESNDLSSGLPSLPKIFTINLFEEGFPVSMGLFKWGTHVYMVSGQEFPGFKNHPDLKLPRWLYDKYDMVGSSFKTYRLSIGDGGMSLSESKDLPLLKQPKLWPIVEKVGHKIYVIESLPAGFEPPQTIPSYEVLNLNDLDRGWITFPSMRRRESGYPFFIKNHLVLGDLICATIHGSRLKFVLDTKTDEWELFEDLDGGHVTNAFGFGNGNCVERFKDLHVVIGIGETRFEREARHPYEVPWGLKPLAIAHFVSLTGKVVSSQELPYFFKGIKAPSSYVKQARVFCVDEEEKTMCAVVLLVDEKTRMDFLYISTFTVGVELSEPAELSRVKVVVKDRHLYRAGLDRWAEGDDEAAPLCLSACFL